VSDLLALTAAVLLLAGNAFFVGAEFALVSTRREQLEPLAAEGSKRARKALQASRQLSLMMSGAQLGITVCSLGLGAVGEPAVAHLIEKPFEAAGMPDQLLHPVAFALALTIVVGLHMVLGEMVPKNIALAGPVRSALWLGPPLLAVVNALRPLIALLNGLSNVVLRKVVHVEPQDEAGSAFTADQVADLIAESHREGLLDDDEQELLSSTVGLHKRTAAQVLLPLATLVTVNGDESAGRVEELSVTTGFSRFPVLGDNRLSGYVHVKDIITSGQAAHEPLDSRTVRRLAQVDPQQPLAEVLSAMQAEGAHMAAVVGADGAPVGVVTLEDVLEELVGQVHDATNRQRVGGSRRVSRPHGEAPASG
jgi:CBS domain containing-hemolysin-like protein